MELMEINAAIDGLKSGTSREKILALQASMLAMDDAKSAQDFPLEHFHAPGLYARQIFMEKGSLVIGKIHRHAHVNTISKGRVWVATEFGLDEMIAPYTFISQPGTKRVVLVQEDTVWTTYHPTEETDLALIEAHVIAPTFDALALDRQKPDNLAIEGGSK